ncbi:twin-arginine translocation pathway signal protein [Variovorax sp. J22R24]|uniref:Acg family FMN-binding oxidoreductase n=1 Tax=Variovorax gracilis TaxID=3053502 RepID=UPI002575D26F|nr:twin-arginine translocation pathway signal protein [Variovorax sp. J22R24]MDM0108565.1 twin-arginine translocation pathway signal protein [Variovorax sp. J22R24]
MQIQRRNALRMIGGGVIAAATAAMTACSDALPADAVVAWQGPGAEADLRHWVLAHAILAPHSHNLQSWLVDLREPDVITLHMDLERLLPETDPFSRQLVMSQGTFLELLDQAARQRGYRAEMQLFPLGAFDRKGPDQRPTARIHLLEDAAVLPDPLFAHVFRRRTNRSPYEMRPPSAQALQAIRDAVTGFPVTVGLTEPSQAAALNVHREIAKQAWSIELSTPRTLLESYKVLRVGPKEIAQHRDGLSLNDPMVRLLTTMGLFDRTKASAPDSHAIQGQIKRFNAAIDSTPAFFWMATADNERVTQLLAGRAYVRAQLAATAHDLAMHPLQQALQEYPEQKQMRAQIHQLLGAQQPGQTIQMWARLGHGPAVGPAPRRSVQSHLLHA